jgi:hypothetical protein
MWLFWHQWEKLSIISFLTSFQMIFKPPWYFCMEIITSHQPFPNPAALYPELMLLAKSYCYTNCYSCTDDCWKSAWLRGPSPPPPTFQSLSFIFFPWVVWILHKVCEWFSWKGKTEGFKIWNKSALYLMKMRPVETQGNKHTILLLRRKLLGKVMKCGVSREGKLPWF